MPAFFYFILWNKRLKASILINRYLNQFDSRDFHKSIMNIFLRNFYDTRKDMLDMLDMLYTICYNVTFGLPVTLMPCPYTLFD